MSKHSGIQLTVPEPCGQDWNGMQPEGSERHCAQCQKVVTDFSRMSDEQLLDYLRRFPTACGRFRKDQLERPLVAIENKAPNWWARLAAGMLLFLGVAGEARSQVSDGKADSTRKTVVLPQDTMPASGYSVYGKVQGSAGEPIAGALVRIYRDSIFFDQTTTAADGSYSIGSLPKGSYSIRFEANGISIKAQDVVLSESTPSRCINAEALNPRLITPKIEEIHVMGTTIGYDPSRNIVPDAKIITRTRYRIKKR